MKTLLGLLLALSLALNVFLWSRLASHSTAPQPQAAAGAEIKELRRQNQELEARRKAAVDSAEADALELARLRNEVGRLRQEAAALPALRAQATQAAELQAKLSIATNNFVAAMSALEQMMDAASGQKPESKEEADAIQCTSNLKQIVLSARFWAEDHQKVFPPDFLTMKGEIESPRVLACPSDPATTPVSDWSLVNPAQITYQYLIPSSPVDGPLRQAFTCPIHGHVAMSDCSVRRK